MRKILFLLVALLAAAPIWAKKKEEKTGLKKIIAVGVVNAGMFAFQGANPANLSTLLQDQIKKQIDASGRYVGVVVQDESSQGLTEEEDEFLQTVQTKMEGGGAMSPQDSLRYSKLMMKQMGPMMQQFGGAAPIPKNVAAQALMTFSANTGEGSMNTGGAIGTLGSYIDLPSGVGDLSTQSVKLTLTCVLHDPQTGQVVDQNKVETTKTKLTSFGSFSTFDNSINHDEAYDKLFSKAVDKCVKWLDKKLEKEPWEGRIFKIEGGRVLLNAGSNAGVAPGMQFHLIKRESVVGTGIHFGSEDATLGMAEALEVKEGYSTLRLLNGGSVKVGVLVRPVVSGE